MCLRKGFSGRSAYTFAEGSRRHYLPSAGRLENDTLCKKFEFVLFLHVSEKFIFSFQGGTALDVLLRYSGGRFRKGWREILTALGRAGARYEGDVSGTPL